MIDKTCPSCGNLMEHEWLEMDFDKAWLLDKGTMILMCEKCGMVFNALHEEAGT